METKTCTCHVQQHTIRYFLPEPGSSPLRFFFSSFCCPTFENNCPICPTFKIIIQFTLLSFSPCMAPSEMAHSISDGTILLAFFILFFRFHFCFDLIIYTSFIMAPSQLTSSYKVFFFWLKIYYINN